MASKPVLWRNSSLNSRMPTTQRYSDWPHSQKYASSAKILVATRHRMVQARNCAGKKTGKRVTLELVGKLHETWLLFRKRVQADRQLYDKLVPQLEAEGRESLNA